MPKVTKKKITKIDETTPTPVIPVMAVTRVPEQDPVIANAKKLINVANGNEACRIATKAEGENRSDFTPTPSAQSVVVQPTAQEMKKKSVLGSAFKSTVEANSSKSVLSSLVKNVSTNPPHVVVVARAGTGKTTTLVEGLKALKGLPTAITPSVQQQAVWDQILLSKNKCRSVCFAAFNKSIAEELKKRVPEGCEASTLHSMGFSAVRRKFGKAINVKESRVDDIACKLLGMERREVNEESPLLLARLRQLVSLCKVNLLDGTTADLDALCDRYDIEFGDKYERDEAAIDKMDALRYQVFGVVRLVLDLCKRVQDDLTIDYDDMIWVPVILDLPCWRNDLLLVDECLPGWTPVMMDNGSSKQIKDIVIGDRVRSYDTTTGRAKNCSVTAVQKIPNKKPLVKIKVKHFHKTAGNKKSNFVVCTTDHKVWTINRGWVEAGEIQIGDSVVVETAAEVTQKGKITKTGRDNLSEIHIGNEKGTGINGGQTAEQFNKVKGGNGRGPTTPQVLLHEALDEGWFMEYPVKTGARAAGLDLPTCYKIDLANPEYKIAVEIDGNSHTKSKEVDQKKDDFLTSAGWKVFRYTNRQIARDFAGILQDICPDGTSCPMPAQVVSVDETYITEHYVYDISVDVCHAFYANGVLVHNCQDMNRCQQALAKKCGDRLILVGDDMQAIYGFAGADSESIPRMTDELKTNGRGCVVLPLTVTRRCGLAIVKEANQYVADFTAHESNCEGTVLTREYPLADKTTRMQEESKTYLPLVQPGDMVLCRANAPLVSQCFKLLKRGVKAFIMGKADVAQGIISLITKMNAKDVPELVKAITVWAEVESDKENAKKEPSESKLDRIADRRECVLAFCEDMKTVKEVIDRIEKLFTEIRDAVRLSSIHKAKGLEAKRVFFLAPNGFRPRHPRCQPWEWQQELNMRYVGITRAIEELIYVF